MLFKQTLVLFMFLTYMTGQQISAQSSEKPIIFIYDGSGSMWGAMDNKTKVEIAREVLNETIGSLGQDQQVGLVAYGHRRKSDCSDVEFMVDAKNTDKTLVTQKISGIQPLGRTPLASSATMVIDHLKSTSESATIILITDGIESCDGNICDVVSAAKNDGIDLKLHIVGFGLKDEPTDQLKCAAEAGNGRYFDAENAQDLSDVLQEVTRETVDKPASNVHVFAVKNGEPVDAYIKAYPKKDKAGYRTSGRTYRDTAKFYLDPGQYDLEVIPLENTRISSITLENVTVTDDSIARQFVSFDGGTIDAYCSLNGEGWDAVVNIYDQQGKLAGGGRTYGSKKSYEMNPGTYKLVFKILQLKGSHIEEVVENVVVRSKEITNVEHDFEGGVAFIGAKSGSELVDATVNFVDVATNSRVDGSRTYTHDSSNPRKFMLNPGTYEVTIKALGAHAGKTAKVTITVEKGKEVTHIEQF